MKARIWKDRTDGTWCSYVPPTGAWLAVSGHYWPTWNSAASHVLAEINRRRRRPGGP